MAEYRGLTIRIGADTGSLTASIRAAQSAMSAAEKQARQLARALVMDSGSKNAGALYIGEIQSQTVAAMSKLRGLKQEMEDLGNTATSNKSAFKGAYGDTIAELAKNTDNAALSARRAKEAYNEVTANLTQMYDELTALSKLAYGEEDYNIFNHQHNDMDDIREEYQTLAEMGLVSQEQADEAINRIYNLKKTFMELSDAYDDARLVEQLHNDEVAAAALEAKIRSLAEQLADATRSDLSMSLDEAVKATERLGSGAELAKNKLANIDRLLEFDPTNVESVNSKISVLSDLQDSLRLKLESVRASMSKLEDAGVDKAAASMSNLAERTEQARKAFVNAQTNVSMLESELDRVEEVKNSLEADNNGNTDQWHVAAAEVNRYRAKIEEAKQELRETKSEYEHLKDANTFAEMSNEAESLRNEMRDVTEQMLAMARSDLSFSLDGEREKLSSISDEAAAAKQRFEDLDAALKLNPTNIDLAKERTEALRDANEKARMKVEQLQSIIEKLKAAGLDGAVKSTKNLTQAVKDAETNFKRAADRVNDIEDELGDAIRQQKRLEESGDTLGDGYKEATSNVERLTSELGEAAREAMEASDNVKTLRDAMELSGSNNSIAGAIREQKEIIESGKTTHKDMTTATFQAFQEMGQYSRQAIQEIVTASYDLEEAFTNMMKTVDGTQEQYNTLRESAVQASLENPVSADQILNVEALGGQLGFTIDELEEFQRVANGLDISTNMGWEDAATNMAQFANITKMNHEDIGRYGAAIVDLGNNFATTEADISDMAMRIAGAGASLGLTQAEILGVSTALTSMGLTAEAGGSSISQIMLKIDKAVANGSDGVKEYASQAGMSVDEFVQHVNSLDSDALTEFAKGFGMTSSELKKSTADAYEQLQLWADTAGYDTADKFAAAWKSSPVEALQAVFTGLGKTVESSGEDVGNLALILDDLNIKTIRQGDVARRLANNSSLLTDAVSAANTAWMQNTALTTEVERRNQSLSGRMDVLKNAFTAVKTELGEGLRPFVEVGISGLTAVVDMLNSLPAPAKTGAIAIMGLVTVVGTAGSALIALKPALTSIIAGWSTFVAGLPSMAALSAGVTAGLSGMAVAAKGFLAALAMNPLTQVVIVLGTLAAAIGVAGKQYYDAQKRASEFKSATIGVKEAIVDMHKASSEGAKDLTSFSEGIQQVMSVEEVTEKLNSFSKSVKDTLKSTRESNALLGEYQTVIDKYAGVGEDNIDASGMAELEWAVSNLNAQLGTNYEAMDVLKGQYEDEKGKIVDLRAEIDNLILTRQRQAEADAANQVYTEALKNQMEMQDQAEAAAKNYYDRIISYRENAMKSGDTSYDWASVDITDEASLNQMGNWLLENRTGFDELHEKMVTTATAADEMGDAVNAAKQRSIDMGLAASEAAQEIYKLANSAFADDAISWAAALERNKIGLDEFAVAALQAGIGAEDLKAIYDDTGVFFANMVDQSGGDLQKLIEIIQEYNNTHPEKKDFEEEGAEEVQQQAAETTQAVQNADGTTATYNLEEDGGDEVQQQAEEATEAVEDADGTTATLEIESQGGEEAKQDVNEVKEAFNGSDSQTSMTITATNEVTPVLEEIKGSIVALNESVTPISLKADPKDFNETMKAAQKTLDSLKQNDVPVLHANISQLAGEVQRAQALINSVYGRSVDLTVNATINGYYDVMNKLDNLISKGSRTITTFFNTVSGSGNAAGGIRYHADGFIADRPTWISNRDIVGEAGAEAIIPLTNKKYVDPFAGAVADQMLSKMHGMDGGNTITVNLNYSAGDDANQMARDLARALGRIQRTGR